MILLVNIVLGIFLIVLLVILIPIKFKVKYSLNTKDISDANFTVIKSNNYLEIYILECIKLKKINLGLKKKYSKDNICDAIYNLIKKYLKVKEKGKAFITAKEIKRINNNLYFKKINLDLGINFDDAIINAYVLCIINAIINIYFTTNQKRINLYNTKYSTNISNELFNLNVDCIIKLKLANTITILLKIFLRVLKGGRKYGRTTSNRGTYDDSNDIFGEYDRC
ncbi:MAG: hypothetical protein RSD14_06300 [Clostridia bacterium]